MLGPAIHGHVPGGRLPLALRCVGLSAQQQAVAQRCDPLRDCVDRRGRDHQQPEPEEDDQPQVGQPDPDRGHDRGGDEPAHPSPGCTHRLGPVTGARRALDQGPDPAGGGQQDPGADRQATGGGPLVRVAQHAQRGPEEEQRDHHVQRPERTGHDGGHDARQPPVDGEPGDSGDDDRQGEQQQADPIAAMRGIEVTSTASHCSRDPAEDRREEQPDAGQGASDCTDEPGYRPWLPPGGRLGSGPRDRARRGAPGLGGSGRALAAAPLGAAWGARRAGARRRLGGHAARLPGAGPPGAVPDPAGVRVVHRAALAGLSRLVRAGQTSTTTGTIIGRRRCVALTQRPTWRRTTCSRA